MEVKAKKYLGQHFLTDLNIARRIAEAVSGPESHEVRQMVPEIGGGRNGDSGTAGASSEPGSERVKQTVLEIGGGMGVLTQFLLQRDDLELWGIEIDRESIAYMREHFPQFAGGRNGDSEPAEASSRPGPDRVKQRVPEIGGGRLIEGDFLKFDLRGFVNDRASEEALGAPRGGGGGAEVTIVGNFPYNISSQIFFKVLENRDLIPEVVGMVQREVAQRIAEPPGSRTYGITSVLLQAWYDIEYLFTVSEGVFSPPPKVKSAVIRLRRNSRARLDCDEALFTKVVKASFGQRRKMLRNAIRAVFPQITTDHPFLTRRAETLSVAEFVELTNWVSEHL